jgi:hypothetical protein
MSVLELESLARKHWQEWLPEKVKELRAEDKFNEAVHGAAVLAQEEIEHLMRYQGYSISEAREVRSRCSSSYRRRRTRRTTSRRRSCGN